LNNPDNNDFVIMPLNQKSPAHFLYGVDLYKRVCRVRSLLNASLSITSFPATIIYSYSLLRSNKKAALQVWRAAPDT